MASVTGVLIYNIELFNQIRSMFPLISTIICTFQRETPKFGVNCPKISGHPEIR